MLTLSAHAAENGLTGRLQAYGGLVIATIALAISVYICYGYAPRLIQAVSPSTVRGILRVIAFILMCIGVQVMWNGISLLTSSPVHR